MRPLFFKENLPRKWNNLSKSTINTLAIGKFASRVYYLGFNLLLVLIEKEKYWNSEKRICGYQGCCNFTQTQKTVKISQNPTICFSKTRFCQFCLCQDSTLWSIESSLSIYLDVQHLLKHQTFQVLKQFLCRRGNYVVLTLNQIDCSCSYWPK